MAFLNVVFDRAKTSLECSKYNFKYIKFGILNVEPESLFLEVMHNKGQVLKIFFNKYTKMMPN